MPRHSFQNFQKEEIEQSLSSRFEAIAQRFPETCAIRDLQSEITYHQLNLEVSRIAYGIQQTLGQPSQPIALLINQGIGLMAAILGILKSGNYYVPLDGRQPQTVLRSTLKTLKPKLLICDLASSALAHDLCHASETEVLTLENLPQANPDTQLPITEPGALAYVYFTSGSTGTPKGVMDSHRNVLHNIMRYTNSLKISPEDNMSLIQHNSFSGAVSSMFGALLNGATLCPFDMDKYGAQLLPAWIKDSQITIFHSVPSVFRFLAQSQGNYDSLRLIRLEGDRATAYDAKLFQQSFNTHCTLVNGLGATEYGLARQYFLDHDQNVDEELPLGYPVADTEILIKDKHGREVDRGSIGEIYVRSKYLALGYWSDPARTQEFFQEDGNGLRIYKSRDLGRLQADGCLEYLGRSDNYTKILGQTVNTTELEDLIGSYKGVSVAVVKAFTDVQHETRLAAYLSVAAEVFSLDQLRSFLKEQVPSFMIPSTIKIMEEMPVSANGKIDRASLPTPAFERAALGTPYVAPSSDLEHLLARLWTTIIKIDQVGALDNFFDLGGDSLKAAQLVGQLAKQQYQVDIVDLFNNPQLRSMAQFLAHQQTSTKLRTEDINRRAALRRTSFRRK